jgi:hypothetical protein
MSGLPWGPAVMSPIGQIWMQSPQPVQRAASMMGRWRRVVL